MSDRNCATPTQASRGFSMPIEELTLVTHSSEQGNYDILNTCLFVSLPKQHHYKAWISSLSSCCASRCGFLIVAPSGDVKKNYISDDVMAT